jgi:hypothetical protein
VQRGEWAALTAMGTAVGSVGANHIATRMQRWQDEADGARRLADEVNREPALRAELDAVLQNLDVFAQARQALPEADRPWFDEALQGELGRLGSTTQYNAHLTGAGAIAQGPGAVACGPGGIVVGGHVHGSINPGPSEQKG